MFRHCIKIIVFFILLIPAGSLTAQTDGHEPLPKAKRAFDNAITYWNALSFDKAEKELQKAIGIDSAFIDPYILLGDIAFDRSHYDDAIGYYNQAIAIDSSFSPTLYYLLGKVYFEKEDYAAAASTFGYFLEIPGIRKDQRGFALDFYQKAEFRRHALENPVPFEPENLGQYVNSEHDEYVNSITLDEKNMVFTLMQPDTLVKGRYTEGFVMAVKADSLWMLAGRALPDLYELGNIGAMSLSPDGRFLFFTSCGAPGGHGSCDLYACGKTGDEWSEPQNLGAAVNTETWDSQPCFSADGQTLYFSSARPGGRGGSDIWFSKFIQGQGWTKPLNAGSGINTREEEMAPFIHPDGKTMYFSSKGHIGMGGFDLFISRKDSSGTWADPENLGWPVNTAFDEINIVVATNGKAAYISARREEGYGGYDIYSFDLPVSLAPLKVSYLEGNIYDADTKKPLAAEIELIDLESGELSVRCRSDEINGHYVAALPGGKNYALNISKPAYLFYSENFNLKQTDVPEESVKMDVYLQAVKAGQSFVLNNIFFDTDQYSLDELSQVELAKLNEFLILNPEIRIMICGHTDAVGTEEYNQTLSENRAGAVYSFLVNAGISPERLQFKGFGKSQPVSDNESEKGRAENRRTEILIL